MRLSVDNICIGAVDEVDLPSIITPQVAGNGDVDAFVFLWDILSEGDDGWRPIFEVNEVDGELGGVGVDGGPCHFGRFTLGNGGVKSWGKNGIGRGRSHKCGEGKDLG